MSNIDILTDEEKNILLDTLNELQHYRHNSSIDKQYRVVFRFLWDVSIPETQDGRTCIQELIGYERFQEIMDQVEPKKMEI